MSTALDVQHLTKHFTAGGTRLFARGAKLHAVDDVSFTLRPGTITALVGESGSGKSTVARMLARLYDPTSGAVLYEGADATQATRRKEILRYRSQVQMIFQDPFGSLNPVKTIAHHIERPLKIHGIVPPGAVTDRVHELLSTVGLVPPDKYAAKYPHELSGGQRQRVAIARALAVEPRVILADEPTSMLDVSIRIGILNLMLALKEERDLAFLYVTHDLASARYVADEMLVMYAGQIVEQGPIEAGAAEPAAPVHAPPPLGGPRSACRRAARRASRSAARSTGPSIRSPAVASSSAARSRSRSARSARPSSSRPVDPRARAVT